jgi:hypothetical protein
VEQYEQVLTETIDHLACPKAFKCCTEGLENLCKAEDVGMQSFVQCLEASPNECPFSKLLAVSYVCTCPLRVYIAKTLKK